jgi:hypothetical protein
MAHATLLHAQALTISTIGTTKLQRLQKAVECLKFVLENSG